MQSDGLSRPRPALTWASWTVTQTTASWRSERRARCGPRFGALRGSGGVFAMRIKCIMVMMFIVDITWCFLLVMIVVAIAIFFYMEHLGRFSFHHFFPSRWLVCRAINQLCMAWSSVTCSWQQVVVKNGPVTSGASLRMAWRIPRVHDAGSKARRSQDSAKEASTVVAECVKTTPDGVSE